MGHYTSTDNGTLEQSKPRRKAAKLVEKLYFEKSDTHGVMPKPAKVRKVERPKFDKYDMYMTYKGKTSKSPCKFYRAKDIDTWLAAYMRGKA